MQNANHRLLTLGMILFLLSLISGMLVNQMLNPRMGLSAHVGGAMNGMFLILVGLMWDKLSLSTAKQVWCFWLVVYGTYANYVFVLLSEIF